MGVMAATVLAQASPGSGGDVGRFLAWIGILIVVVVLGTIVLLMLRKRLDTHRNQADDGYSTMEEMRAMVARGDMSQEEFDKVRKAMAAKIRPNPDRATADAGTPGPMKDDPPPRARTDRESHQ
mgnify:CR=1 FL=1